MNTRRLVTTAALIFSLFTVIAPAQADLLALTSDGVRIDAGRVGNFTLSYPALLKESGESAAKIIQLSPGNNGTETIQYDNGTRATLTLLESRRIQIEFAQVTADVKKYRMDIQLGFSLIQGGKWQAGSDTPFPFPAETPKNPNFYQGNARSMTLTDVQGDALGLTVPEYSFLQLTDARPWNWKNFTFMLITPLNPAAPKGEVAVTFQEGASGVSVAQVDPFGQPIGNTYPDKITSESDLKKDVAVEKQYYVSLIPPKRDPYGGLPGSKANYGLQATGFFHVEKKAERWILVDPVGNAFFQLGVCELGVGDDFTHIAGRESTYQWLPEKTGTFATAYRRDSGGADFSFYLANTIRKYDKPYDNDALIQRMIGRLRKWGFNSGGPFAEKPPAYQAEKFVYASSLPISWPEDIPMIPGIGGTWDPFDTNNRQKLDRNFAAEIAPKETDPLILGYFLTNEPLYEDIPRVIPRLNGTFACKRRLVSELQSKYRDIARFNTAWGMEAKSFDALIETGLPVTTPAAQEDIKTFTTTFLEEYYRLVAEIFHKYDHHHMLIGNRFQAGTINSESLCRIAGKYLDIMSFNYYTYGIDRDFMNRIYAWTGRPMILSEYFYDSPTTTGLPGGILDMKTQHDRGLAYRNYVEQAASLGYVVGTEWFTLVDQSVTGRWFQGYDGERANTGLLSVTDRPYKDALAQMMLTNYGIYDVVLKRRPAYVLDDPRFTQQSEKSVSRTLTISRATGPVALDGTNRWFSWRTSGADHRKTVSGR